MSFVSDIMVVPMQCEHLAKVIAIEEVSFTTPWKKEHFLQEIASLHSFPFVAVKFDIVIGYICIMSLFEEAQILDVAVAARYMGKGVGGKLITFAESLALDTGAEYMALEVRDSNHAARCLYEKLGYCEIGRRKLYYDGKEDAILMEKVLNLNV